MRIQPGMFVRLFLSLAMVVACLAPATLVRAQTETTGAFRGKVMDAQTKQPIPRATVQIIYQLSEVPVARQTDDNGVFYLGMLTPGRYLIRAIAPGYKTHEQVQILLATQTNTVLEIPPIMLEKETAATIQPTQPTQPTTQPTPTTQTTQTTQTQTQTAQVSQQTAAASAEAEADVGAQINAVDGRRIGAFTEKEVRTLPLGATTLTRTFDELALLLPGVALPPQTLGTVAGPGVGSGVGSAGQFAVNGLRSRSNNFTVDGADNNDEDIGVRRQGFFALVPQPVESIQQYQVTTLLAPAQYGRNIGGQVNANSKRGTNGTHGTIFGFISTSQLNARNAFDTSGGRTSIPLQGRTLVRTNAPGELGTLGGLLNVFINGQQKFVTNSAAASEDSFTLGQGGVVMGGPLMPDKMFYFLSFEGQVLNATKESNFAVPTVEERGLFNSGASGIFRDPIFGFADRGFATRLQGDAIFSLFPFPNNPGGIYGRNTYTEALPANAQGKIASGRFDYLFKLWGKQQTFTARYNFTDDWRDIPVTGGALFSTLRPRVRTQNISTFFNGAVTDRVFNEVRLSYGRTRLIFDENRNPYLTGSVDSPAEPFLLNAQLLINNVLPAAGTPNNGRVDYNTCTYLVPGTQTRVPCTVEQGFGPTSFFSGLGRLGQVNIAGYSPVGVDVFNFPQRRVNNTYQLVDTMTWRAGSSHNLTFGADIRRSELDSDLPRNSRTLLTFNGSPLLDTFDLVPGQFLGLARPVDYAAAGAPSGAFLSLNRAGTSAISLRYYQFNFFGQDEWRVSPRFSLSFGLRYEYNTPPRELNRFIERSFTDQSLDFIPGLRQFINGRTSIFDADRNNFAPRVGFAYSPRLFGDKTTVIRGGYGIYYDQILGAVVSQSRNVFPNFVTLNTGAFTLRGDDVLREFNPARGGIRFASGTFVPLVQPGTLNTFNPALTLGQVINLFSDPAFNFASPVTSTLPGRDLKTPMAHHYSVTVEQALSKSLVFSAAYVGTLGRNLLRFTTPNLGPNNLVIPSDVFIGANPDNPFEPAFEGFVAQPNFGRPVPSLGAVNVFTTTATSRYDALQVQLRGRLRLGGFLHFLGGSQFQANYTFSKVEDDVSDVFDLAGAPALPQNSQTFAGERGPANFDTRHRFSYNMISEVRRFKNSVLDFLIGGLQFASTSMFQTGQPFTVNSIYDINLDGNLTDRLDNTTGLVVTGDRAQPLRLTTTNLLTLLAGLGNDGRVARNSFRAGSIWTSNVAIIKSFNLGGDAGALEGKRLTFRMEIFNLFNRSNFGIPVRFLEAPGFGRATDTVTPARRIQFSVKFSF